MQDLEESAAITGGIAEQLNSEGFGRPRATEQGAGWVMEDQLNHIGGGKLWLSSIICDDRGIFRGRSTTNRFYKQTIKCTEGYH